MTSELFIPTYLYIKQHSVTGKLYFGKTYAENPETYLGSGDYWTKHINAHGKEHVVTLWYCLFLDKESIVEFALSCSKMWNIVESDDWANLKEENGLDGGCSFQSDEAKLKNRLAHIGKRISDEIKRKLSTSHLGKTHTDDTKIKLSKLNSVDLHPFYGKTHSIETKQKMAAAKVGIPHRTVTCPVCNKIGGVSAMKRYHFDNCRLG